MRSMNGMYSIGEKLKDACSARRGMKDEDWRRRTGKITISPDRMNCPSSFFLAKAEIARRAIEDAVSKPGVQEGALPHQSSLSKFLASQGRTETEENTNGVHLKRYVDT